MKIKNITLIFLITFSIGSSATESTSFHPELSPYDIGHVQLNKQRDIKQAQILSDEVDALTNKVIKCVENKKLGRQECYCLYPNEIFHLKTTYKKLIDMYPAWKSHTISWQRMVSNHKTHFSIPLGHLRFMLFESKCLTNKST